MTAARQPTTDPALSRVVPLAIFAASRPRFEALVRGFANSIEVKILIFNHLPLEQYGWDRETAKVRKLRNEPQGMVFLVERQ